MGGAGKACAANAAQRTLVRIAATVCTLVAASGAPALRAAEWSLEPSADARLSYNDNIALTPGVKDDVWGYQLAPRAVFAWREALTELAGEARLGLNRYPGKADLNTTDVLAGLRATTSSELNGYGLVARLERDSTLATEARTTGVVQARRQRTQKTLAPSYRRTLDPRATVNFGYQYTDIGYERGAGLRDYASHSFSAGYGWEFSERLRTDTSVSWSRLRTDDRSLRNRTGSISQAFTFALTEKISLGLNAGWRRTRTTVNRLQCPQGAEIRCILGLQPLVPVDLSTTERGLTLGADASGKVERGRWGVAFSRGTSPTGDGLVVRTDRFGVQWGGDWTEHITYGLSGAWLRSVYDGNLGDGSKYLTFDASTDWRLDERWTAGARYAFVRSRTDGGSGSARSNAVYFTLSYQWPPVSLK